ncbi:hypothetical protein [Jeotgalibacillus marinus]|uniref:Uncharacterized protein n=1 Tax=Jeotgalibacillus marinus TaxID=86667 RepID=A0ABV3Q3U8_9BACL
MRMTIGYITVGLLLPLCILLWIGAIKEIQTVSAVNDTLAKSIDVTQSFPEQ